MLDQLPPVSQLKPIPWSTGLSGVTTTGRLATFSKSFYGLPIGSFVLSKAPLYFWKDPSKMFWFHVSSLSCSAILNFLWIPGHARIPKNEHADSLPKAGTSLSTAMVK